MVTSKAQNTSDLLVKYHEKVAFRPTLRYDHFLESGSYFYIENTNILNDYPPIGKAFPVNKISQMEFMAGYEHKGSDHWYFGLSEKMVVLPSANIYTSRVNINHRGKIGGIHFVKEGAFEFYKYPKLNRPNVIDMNYGSVNLGVSLLKEFKINDNKFFVGVSYRGYYFFDFLKDGYSAYSKRLIDKTLLKVEVDYFITKRLLASLFFVKQTNYSYQLATTNSMGNVVTPESRINDIMPTFGMALNFVMNAPKDFIPLAPINKDFVY